MAEHAPADLSAYLGECRDLVITEISRLFDHRDEHRQALYDLILDYPLREGKALRPALSIALCCGLGGTVDAVLPTAATMELYHNAFLIHDDIEDESLVRRGEPTLHLDHGVPVAVNVGDAMLCLSLQPLLDNIEVIGLGPALRILQTVANMTRESVEGQALELEWVRANRWDLDDGNYREMVIQKTGWYSFIAPMQVGAIAAGASAEAITDLIEFGQALGIAFQITDDVLNLRGVPEDYGKEIGGDLWEGKRTVILLHALRNASAVDRRRAVEIMARPRPDPGNHYQPSAELLDQLVSLGELTEAGRTRIVATTPPAKSLSDIHFLADLINRHGSLDYARSSAGHHASQAGELLEKIDWLPESRHRRILTGLVDYVHQRTR